MQTTKQQILNSAKSLFFTHNRGNVDVRVFGEKDSTLIDAKGVDSDVFLEYFDYGTTIFDPSFFGSTDSRENMVAFLTNIL